MQNRNKLIILSILFTTSNILCSLTDLNGKVIYWASVGSIKTKGVKKITSIAVIATLKKVTSYITKNTNYKKVYLKIRGFNKGKKIVIKYLNQSFFNILLISDNTSNPHNGCKKKRKKRI